MRNEREMSTLSFICWCEFYIFVAVKMENRIWTSRFEFWPKYVNRSDVVAMSKVLFNNII